MKKIILMLLLCISFAYAKEVNLNSYDFLDIKYGTSKEEVLEKLENMNIKIEKEEHFSNNLINVIISNFELSYFDNNIDCISLFFADNKFYGVDISFFEISSISTYYMYKTFVELNYLLLKDIKTSKDYVNLYFRNENSSANILFKDCKDFEVKEFCIQYLVKKE